MKPFGAVTTSTISRWIKTVMARSGIDVSKFGSHSVRSVATSTAKSNCVPIKDILNKAGWSNESTFAKFYDKKMDKEDHFERGVLMGNK